MKGKEALDECIRTWQLNDTFNGTAVNHGRMLSPDGKMCLFGLWERNLLLPQPVLGLALLGRIIP